MQPKITVRNLYKIFGNSPEKALALSRKGLDKDEIFDRTGNSVAVRDASFEVFEGEIFVVMGLSGSGKSTLVRLFNRLIDPTAGSVVYEGVDIAAMSTAQVRDLRRKDMSMVFQSFALLPHLNVLDNVAFGLELAGMALTQRRERALEALEQVGLETNARSYPDELSGGMQQRVGLARALAKDPSVILMDEAFSALDPLIRTGMQDELLDLQERCKRTIVFISHDLDEAIRIGDRIAIMQNGSVVQVGAPEEIISNPINDYVASFFRGVDVRTVFTAGDIARDTQITVIKREGVGVRAALSRLKREDRDFGYVVGADRRFYGVVSVDTLSERLDSGDQGILTEAFLPDLAAVDASASLSDVIAPVAQAPCAVPVTDADGRYLGVISKVTLLEKLAPAGREIHG